MKIDPDKLDVFIDREQAFLLYATFTGDLEKTAHALNVPAVAVLKMADDEGWNEKLAPILKMKKSVKPGDMERSMNRAVNYVQGHRMRIMITRTLSVLLNMTEEDIKGRIDETTGMIDVNDPGLKDSPNKTLARVTKSKPGSFSRLLADLASALEKCHSMTYQALNDTVQERTKRKEDNSDASVAAMHAQIADAMADAKVGRSPRGLSSLTLSYRRRTSLNPWRSRCYRRRAHTITTTTRCSGA